MTLADSPGVPGEHPWYRFDQGRDALLLEVHVQPGASRTRACGLHGGRLKVALAAPAVDGRANRLLIEFLSDNLAASPRNVRIVRGEHSRHKLVMIEHPGAAADGVLLAWAQQ